ncbi:winged helix-turn-helix domain-containing protein [Kitasatospora sp. NPDC018058]|uniref:winged helix-turn-helix domain-containing protein n=1 Tax=Kitasatospora sp. NPDC018058 TaxID=3364025 RepID=UPI0037C11808
MPPTLRQGVVPRLRLALEILTEQPSGMHVQQLWARVVADLPLEAHEAVLTKSGRQTKGENNWRWYTSDAVLAGLIWKQKGVWRITSLGRHVLAQSDAPEDLLEITRSALSYAEKHRAGYQYATKILETAVPPGRWVALRLRRPAPGRGADPRPAPAMAHP